MTAITPEGDRSNIIAMGLVSMFTDFASSLVTPILPLFLVIILDEGADKVGFVTATATIVSYILRIGGGVLSDRTASNKPFLVIGYTISALSKPLFGFSSGWTSVAGLRAVERLGKAVRAAPKDRLITLSGGRKKTGRAFGLHKTLDVLGEFGGLVVVCLVLAIFGSGETVFRNIFRASLIPGVIAVALLIFVVRDVGGGENSKSNSKKPKAGWARFSAESALQHPFVLFSAFTLFMFSEPFMLLRAEANGFLITGILLLLISSKMTQTILSYRTGVLLDEQNPQRWLSVGYGLGLLALILLLPMNPIALLISFVVYGGYIVISLNSIRTLIGTVAVEKGLAFGTFYLYYALASSVGAVWIGLFWERMSATHPLIISIIGASCVLALSLKR